MPKPLAPRGKPTYARVNRHRRVGIFAARSVSSEGGAGGVISFAPDISGCRRHPHSQARQFTFATSREVKNRARA